ncbi:hypothetical protein MU1_07860 [Paenibacillus glycanilyticus]|uniref:Uncharacterized protein n=1 Tax=Paenibacillus glycanilyticus TaxID=126569 RepID=A0ABQ6GBI6_9BACL|nr:hypothetical protein MU1_07860 [Paenibacillus glycanilyticus]
MTKQYLNEKRHAKWGIHLTRRFSFIYFCSLAVPEAGRLVPYLDRPVPYLGHPVPYPGRLGLGHDPDLLAMVLPKADRPMADVEAAEGPIPTMADAEAASPTMVEVAMAEAETRRAE